MLDKLDKINNLISIIKMYTTVITVKSGLIQFGFALSKQEGLDIFADSFIKFNLNNHYLKQILIDDIKMIEEVEDMYVIELIDDTQIIFEFSL